MKKKKIIEMRLSMREMKEFCVVCVYILGNSHNNPTRIWTDDFCDSFTPSFYLRLMALKGRWEKYTTCRFIILDMFKHVSLIIQLERVFFVLIFQQESFLLKFKAVMNYSATSYEILQKYMNLSHFHFFMPRLCVYIELNFLMKFPFSIFKCLSFTLFLKNISNKSASPLDLSSLH